MARNYRTLFSPVGHFFDGLANTISLAQEINTLNETPDSVFRARGTTRQDVIRAAMKLG